MPFWSDWLHTVTQRALHVRPPPRAATDRFAPPDEPRAVTRRRASTHAEDRPGPAIADHEAAPGTTEDDAIVELLHERETAAACPGDEVGQWHARLFDLLADGVLLFDAQGQTAYRNAAAAALIDDDGHQILREARALALTVTLPVPDVGRRPAGRDAAREVTLGAIHFRLSAVAVPASLPRTSLPPVLCEPAVLVTITRTSPALPSPTVLRRRFQLTAREASVALLLAEGRSNAGVARRLGISENTVRHYIETVLLKLDVPSRAAVAAALLGVYEHTDEHAVPRTRKSPVAD